MRFEPGHFEAMYTYGSDIAAIVEGDVGKHNTLPVVEANVEVPFLPVDSPSVQLERHTFGLSNMNRLEIVPEANFLLNRLRIVISRRCFVQRPALFGDVDVNDFLGFDIVDWTEVERVGILQVVDVGPVVHQSLLEP